MKALSVYIEITSKCNLMCCYCYNSSGSHGTHVSSSTVKGVLADCRKVGCKQVILSGGEPFLHPDLTEILEATRDIGFETVIIATNGTIIDHRVLELCKDLSITIQVSMNLDESITYEQTKAMNFINLKRSFLHALSQHSLASKASLHTVVMRHNALQLERVAQLASEFRIPSVSYSWLVYKGRSREADNYVRLQLNNSEMKNAIDTVKRIRDAYSGEIEVDPLQLSKGECLLFDEGLEELSLRVSANGDVFPCPDLTKKEHSIGNIFNGDILEFVSKESLKVVTHNLLRLYDTCKRCAIGRICMAGCPAFAEYYEELCKEEFGMFCGLKKLEVVGR